jgi:purine-binding chemotaxis protein CheW
MSPSALAAQARAVRQFATFLVGDLFFGIDVRSVQEVLKYQEMTMVPLAPGAVEGLIHLRGQIILALDVRRRLGLAARDPGVQPMNVVIRTPEGPVSLLVDDIDDVIDLAPECFEPPPPHLPAHLRGLISAVGKLEGRLMLVLDCEQAVRLAPA